MKHLLAIIIASTTGLCILLNCATAIEPQDDTAGAAALEPAGVLEARKLFVQALKETGGNRIAGLRQSFERLEAAAAADEQLPPALTMWGRLLLTVGDVRLARQALQQATTVHVDSPDAYALLGSMAASAGQLTEASLCYDRASRLLEKWPLSHPRHSPLVGQIAAGRASVAQARSAMLASMNQPALMASYDDAALANLLEWVSIAPKNAVAHERLAAALIATGDTEGAIASFNDARALDPSLPLTEFRLAKAMLVRGDPSGALEQVNRAIRLEKIDASVRLTAANLFLSLAKVDSAKEQITKTLSTEPDNTRAKLLQAQSERFLGNWQMAAEILQGLSTKSPADFEVANLLALTLSEVNSDDARQRAVALASVTSQRFDQLDTVPGRRARITLIWTAFAAGQQQAAKKEFKALLEAGISSNQVSGDEAYYVSRLLVEFGRPELASTLLSNVLSRVEAFPKRKDCEQLLAQLK
jgi:tetratricopeptide (TPR) repeat protein